MNVKPGDLLVCDLKEYAPNGSKVAAWCDAEDWNLGEMLAQGTMVMALTAVIVLNEGTGVVMVVTPSSRPLWIGARALKEIAP